MKQRAPCVIYIANCHLHCHHHIHHLHQNRRVHVAFPLKFLHVKAEDSFVRLKYSHTLSLVLLCKDLYIISDIIFFAHVVKTFCSFKIKKSPPHPSPPEGSPYFRHRTPIAGSWVIFLINLKNNWLNFLIICLNLYFNSILTSTSGANTGHCASC